MAFDDAAVAEIERLYADATVHVAEIARRFKCSSSSISRLARKHGWPMRWERLGRSPRAAIAQAPRQQAVLMERLCRAATKQLEQMEKGMESGDMSAADYERLAKSVGAIIGGMEKVAAVQDGGDGDDKAGAGAQRAVADVERRRHEIAERLERLARERAARERSPEPRPGSDRRD